MRRLVLALLLAGLALPALVQETVFYKCTDGKGNVSVQNGTPCASGMKQEIRRVGAVLTVPVPTRRPKVEEVPTKPAEYGEFVLVSGPQARRTPAPEAATLPLPPPLYQCSTWNGDTYYGESAEPEPRCAPLQVVGLNGGAGMGQACEMKYDRCSAVPEAQLCESWYRRLDEADFKLRYADDDSRAQRQADFDAIDAKIKASRCATSAPAVP